MRASLPEPHLLAVEIAADLRSALEQIEDVLGDPPAAGRRRRPRRLIPVAFRGYGAAR